jgi:hypothetical protein
MLNYIGDRVPCQKKVIMHEVINIRALRIFYVTKLCGLAPGVGVQACDITLKIVNQKTKTL